MPGVSCAGGGWGGVVQLGWGPFVEGVNQARVRCAGDQLCWGLAVPGIICAKRSAVLGGQPCWPLPTAVAASIRPASFHLMTAGHLPGKIDGCCHSGRCATQRHRLWATRAKVQLQSGWEPVWGFREDGGSSLHAPEKCSCCSVLPAFSSSLPSWKPASSPCQGRGQRGLSCSSSAPPLPAPRDEKGGASVPRDPSAGSGLLSLA